MPGRSVSTLLVVATSTLVACSIGDDPPPTPGGEGAVSTAEVPVRLRATLSFSSEKSMSEGTARSGVSYAHRFVAECSFAQNAFAWKNQQTGVTEVRLAETEPGVLVSEATGTAQASGDASVVEVDRQPPLTETATVRLGGPMTYCLLRRLDPAEFGRGHDIELAFQVALTGTAQTTTQLGDSTSVRPTGGLALPPVLSPEPSGEDGSYSLVDDPGNTGLHLHAAPLLVRPELGERPVGAGAEIEARQQVYDGLRANPQTAWIGLRFDAERETWTYTGSRVTGAGETHTLRVTIAVER